MELIPGRPDEACEGATSASSGLRQRMDNDSPMPWAGDEFRMIFAGERLSVWTKDSCALHLYADGQPAW